jgi:hypothetical protein
LVVSSYVLATNEPHTIAFPDPVSLQAQSGGPAGLFLSVAHVFAIVEAVPARTRRQWRVTSRMYEYSLLDLDETELLVYHWQPDADPAYPHIHVSAALRARTSALEEKQSIDLDRLHLPTGRVSLEAVVRMLITEFGIAPRRSNWQEVLKQTEAIFREDATWRI